MKPAKLLDQQDTAGTNSRIVFVVLFVLIFFASYFVHSVARKGGCIGEFSFKGFISLIWIKYNASSVCFTFFRLSY